MFPLVRFWRFTLMLFAASAMGAEAFSLRQLTNEWWLVSPSGQPFFSHGVCMITPGLSREAYDTENPAYAWWQNYPSEAAWTDASLARLTNWGFTTVGAWSEGGLLRASDKMLRGITPVLHMGSTAGAPWWDMWDEKVMQRMDDIAREQIIAIRDDPRLIGYYSDNEMGWWNATLFHMALEQAPTSGQRERLIKLLREVYDNDWKKLEVDFEPEMADGWEKLEQKGQLWLRGGGNGARVMRRFLEMVATRYYQLTHDIIRKYDQRALILGDRYQSFYYPEVARAARPFVDAISSNLNGNWNDGSYVRFYLDTLHRLTGKPIFISEYYMAADENRSGNRNSHGQFPRVANQKQRAVATRKTLESLAREPFIVGADWFQYFDEPTHGREDGENHNFGLVDIFDQPYEPLTQMFSRLRLNELKAAAPARRLDARDGIPRAPKNPLASAGYREVLRDWDRERGFVPSVSEFPVGDLYGCWNGESLFLGLYAYDIVEDAYYRNRAVPKVDRAVWTVQAGGMEIRARIGAEREPLINDAGGADRKSIGLKFECS